mgnify:CR=1 FL=1
MLHFNFVCNYDWFPSGNSHLGTMYERLIDCIEIAWVFNFNNNYPINHEKRSSTVYFAILKLWKTLYWISTLTTTETQYESVKVHRGIRGNVLWPYLHAHWTLKISEVESYLNLIEEGIKIFWEFGKKYYRNDHIKARLR